MEEIITTRKLSKYYGKVHAVDGISLSVRKGEIYGFLGLNGAGKTTTIRLLLGMVRPTSGESFICGKRVDAGNYHLWRDIGYLVEMPYSYPDLSVKENLAIIGELRGMSGKKCIDDIMGTLKLSPYSDRKAKHLSLGNAQRLGLAKALLHHPSILILDEPANGLDPAGIVEIRELLSDLAANHGVTVFISSHILGEISKLATRIGIIHNGMLLQELDAGQLNGLRKKRLLINARDHEALKRFLAGSNYQAELSEQGHFALSDPKAIANPDTMAQMLVQAGVPPVFLKVEEEDLESYFLRIIGGAL
ncbi:MAG: ABC transporter ATP-binding protein [Chitinispirillaceae bacterium]|jgi:ABC-2 type transport system ATP-binding protein